ncbi:MAG: helicase-related protein, partial [Afipia sp.]
YFKPFLRQTMVQLSQFTWKAKPEANDIVYDALQPAVRFKRSDVVELPPVSYSYHKVDQSAEQTRVYKELVKSLSVAFKQGTVTAANEGVMFSKLLQIASGWVYTKDRQIVTLDPRPRLDETVDIIQQSEGKVIVFADFIHTADLVCQHLSKKFSTALVTGKVPSHVRNGIFGAFQRMDSPRVLVAHPKCMAHGLTLTEANTIIWYSPTLSLETYEQACARITRPGQTRKQLIVHLTGTPIESKVYRRLREKASIQGALLDMFTEASA